MSAADYFTKTALVAQTLARASAVNTNLSAIEAAFGRLPDRAVLDTGRVTFCLTAGAADVYTVTMHKTPAAYYNGMSLIIEVHATNTGACTINVDSLGAKAIKILNGTEPAAGDLTAGDFLALTYDSDSGYFVITSVVRSIINGNASMSDAAIKTAYENNADTNALTNALKAKLDFITVTQAIDLDNVAATPFEADGAITAGDPVAINSDGTISTVTHSSGGVDKGTRLDTGHAIYSNSMTGRKPLVKIEEGKVLCVFGDDDDAADHGVAFVVTYDEDDVTGTIAKGTSVEFEAGGVYGVSACLVSPNKVLVVSVDSDNTNQGTAVVLRIAGTDIEVGTPVVFDTGSHAAGEKSVACCKVNEDKAVVFSGAGDGVYVCTITGLTPAFGSKVSIDGTSSDNADLCQLSEDRFLIVYEAGSDSNYINGKVGSVNGTVPVFNGSATRIHTTDPATPFCGFIKQTVDSEYAVCTSLTSAHLVKVQGDTVTSEDTISLTEYSGFGCSDELFASSGPNGSSDFSNYYYEVDTGTDTLTYRAAASETGTHSLRSASLGLDSRKFMVLYHDTGNAYINLHFPRPSTRKNFIGYALATVADGANCSVSLPYSVNAQQTGLTPLTHYWLDWDGSHTTEETDVYAGFALSATEILVGGPS